MFAAHSQEDCSAEQPAIFIRGFFAMLKERTLLIFPKRAEASAIKKFLEVMGSAAVDVCSNGTEAWGSLNLRKYGLVMTDSELPGELNGMDLVKRISADKHLCTMPVIMISSENRKNKIMEAIYAGVGGYILRPYSHAILEGKISQLIKVRSDLARKKTQVEQGSGFLKQGKINEAIKTFSEAVEDEPSDETLYLKGYQLMAEGKYNNAIIAFRKAIELNHLYAEAYRGLGEAYMKKGDIEQAEKFLIKAGQLFIQRTQFDEAREAIMMALQVNPNSPNPYNTLGIVYRKTGDFRKSVQYYRLALQIDSEDEKIYYNLAHALVESNQTDKAIEALDAALRLKSDFSEARSFKKHLQSGPAPAKATMPSIYQDRYEMLDESHDKYRIVIKAKDNKTGRLVRIVQYSIPDSMKQGENVEKLSERWKDISRTEGLNHPNIVLTYDVAEDDDLFYLVQEWVEGQNVEEVIQSMQQVPLRMALEISIAVADVLGFMHKTDILHQSLTPRNVVITADNQIKVNGFCLYNFESILNSELPSSVSPLNLYLAPEHFTENPLQPASDVFSLGAIFYEMVMGEPAFAGDTLSSLVYRTCFVEPKPFRHHIERLSNAVQAIFEQSLMKNPTKRIPTGDKMAEALTDALDILDRNWRTSPQFIKYKAK